MFDLSSLVSLFVLAVIGWVGWAIYKIYIWPFYISPMRKIPGPPSENPLFGNFKTLITKNDPQTEWVQKYGKIVKFHGMFNKPSLFVADTKIIQDITTNHSYDYVKPLDLFSDFIAVLGKGLILAEGEDHKRQRKMMNPAFIHNNIKEMVPTFTRVASTLKDLIENKVSLGESNINLSPYISKTTLDIIGLVGFNYGFDSSTSSNELAEAYSSITNPQTPFLRFAISRLANYIPLVRKIPIDENKKYTNACAVIDRASKKLIKEKYNELEKGELKGNDLLSLLININKTLPIEEKMTDEELKYQIMTFLFAGHETTSTSTSWALYLLAQHPHVQDLLREELVKAFPDKSKFNPTFDEINSLEYLNCVIKETLRINSPILTVTRTNIKDENFGEYFIPKNTVIFIAMSAIHKLPEIWGPTANDFNPNRWLDPSLTKNISNINYLPFLAGTRTCIGNKLALTEFKVLLSMLIRNFVFRPIEGFHLNEATLFASKPSPYLGLAVSRVEG